jgi:hypothetical protein
MRLGDLKIWGLGDGVKGLSETLNPATGTVAIPKLNPATGIPPCGTIPGSAVNIERRTLNIQR